MLVDLPLGCSFLLSFWQSSPVGQRLVTGPYRSAGKTGKCALQLGSHVALNLRVPLLKNRKTHGGIHKKCPVLQAVISGFIVSTLTITHNVGARCQRSGLLSAPSLVLPPWCSQPALFLGRLMAVFGREAVLEIFTLFVHRYLFCL